MAHVDALANLRISRAHGRADSSEPYHTIGRWGRGRVPPMTLNARDLDYLLALFTHGALSSDMLGALAAPGLPQRVTTAECSF